ncbi:MAG: hypothetical protein EPO07_02340 [Verrucomicrobia bacterium]|nr:MAG: hypothetical protein EPO07_02340 [Verrucomicrobiota bacterium]
MKTINRIRAHRSANGAAKQASTKPASAPASAPRVEMTEQGIPRLWLALLSILKANGARELIGIKPGLIQQLLKRFGWKMNCDQLALALSQLASQNPPLIERSTTSGWCVTLAGLTVIEKHRQDSAIGSGDVAVTLEDQDTGGVERVKLQGKVFLKLAERAKLSGLPFVSFIEEIVIDHLEGFPRSPALEMECAMQQNSALMVLLEHEILHPTEGGYSGEIQCGVIELTSATKKRLAAAVEARKNDCGEQRQAA